MRRGIKHLGIYGSSMSYTGLVHGLGVRTGKHGFSIKLEVPKRHMIPTCDDPVEGD